MPKEDIQENHDVAEEATEQAVEPSAEKPPWEKDGEEFDAARAWKLNPEPPRRKHQTQRKTGS